MWGSSFREGRYESGGARRVARIGFDAVELHAGHRYIIPGAMTPPHDPVADSARLVHQSFLRYDEAFRRITARAPRRFLDRDWRGAHEDRIRRLDLWEESLASTVAALEDRLGSRARERGVWHRIKEHYGARVDGFHDSEFARTFFTSVTRRLLTTVGTDPLVEFVLDLDPDQVPVGLPATRVFLRWENLAELFSRVLAEFSLGIGFEDAARGAAVVSEAVVARAWRHYRHPNTLLRVELVSQVFYQSTRAFLVGKAEGEGWTAPLAIGLERRDGGLAVDGVYMSDEEFAILFGFTRSYFFVDLEDVGSVVHFLRPLLPDKPLDELYSVLGRIRQGKTERYRDLARHLRSSEERFVPAPGTKGMVMIVFTLPGHHLVYKVIRDRFARSKKVSRRQVVERYKLVSRHDRVGRLIDVQAFRHLAFPLSAFTDEVLEELIEEAGHTVHLDGERLVFDHLYMERKVTPLNLFLQSAGWRERREAVLDYGQSIKDMALINIFPGDMLLKNFGVTRHGRVIFYDFDEVTLLTECRFRSLPRARDDELELCDEVWFEVAEGDVFPEQFGAFLGLDTELQATFLERHGDLVTLDFWRRAQAAAGAG